MHPLGVIQTYYCPIFHDIRSQDFSPPHSHRTPDRCVQLFQGTPSFIAQRLDDFPAIPYFALRGYESTNDVWHLFSEFRWHSHLEYWLSKSFDSRRLQTFEDLTHGNNRKVTPAMLVGVNHMKCKVPGRRGVE